MEENIKGKKWINTLGRVLLFCASCAAMLALSSGLTKGWTSAWSQVLSIAIAGACAFLLTLIFIRWEGCSLKDIGLVPGHNTLPRLLIGFVAGSGLALLQPMLVLMTGHITLVYNPDAGLNGLIINLFLYLAIAGREEIAFRGYPLRSLNYVIGPRGAQAIVAIIFIAEHVTGGMTWPQAIVGSGMGAILFGLAALKTKGIALSVGLHWAWNFGQWSLGFKNNTGFYHVVVEKGYEARAQQAGWASYIVVMALAIVFFYYWRKSPSRGIPPIDK